ncbi:MAG: PKD domain-containing protein [Saprospiraceae bacterium]|nr:PKD domain-containing protein [Saprospiraceae bacterium]
MLRHIFILLFLLPHLISAQSNPYPASFEPRGFGGGGYTYSPAISPHNSDHLFLVCDMGGVYRSTDQGYTWRMIPNDQLTSTVKGKIQFTSDPNLLFAVGRTRNLQSDPWYKGGLVRSQDGGATWAAMPDPTSSGVHRLEVDPGSTQRMLLNEYNQLFFTNDGGASWNVVWHPASDQMWLGGVFWSGDTILVGTHDGLLASYDGGNNFNLENHAGLPAGSGIYHLSGGRSGDYIRLFIVTAPIDQLYAWIEPRNLKGQLTGAFRMDYTTDADWVNTRSNIPDNFEIAWVDLSIRNTDIIWAEGNEPDDFPHTWRSTNGGLTWQDTYLTSGNENISTGWAGSEGPFWTQFNGAAWGIEVADQNPDMMLRASGYGEITTDGGQFWRSTYVRDADQNPVGTPTLLNAQYASSGLDVTTAHHLYWKNKAELFLSNTDVGMTYSPDTGQTWTWARNTFFDYGPVANNNWYRIAHNASQTRLYAAVANINDMYSPERIRDEDLDGAEGLLLHSIDGGLHFDTLFNFGHPVVWVATHPVNPERLWVSVVNSQTGGIYRSETSGQTWQKLLAPPRTEGHPYNIVPFNDGGLLATYAARAQGDGVTLTESSGVFYSPDGGMTWQDRSAAAMRFYTKDVVVDPTDLTQNTWYATVWGRFSVFPGPNNQGNGGLYKTTDRGLTWKRIFEHELTESITLHPDKPGQGFVSVENEGLYYSGNLNDVQPQFEKVSGFPFWRPKRVFYEPENPCAVWITTMGGGLWRGENPAPQAGFSLALSGLTATFSNTSSNAATYFWDFGDGFTSAEVSPVHTYAQQGIYTITLTANSACGTSIRTYTVSPTSNTVQPTMSASETVFPNPNNGQISIEGVPPGEYTATLYNMLGMTVDQQIIRDGKGNFSQHLPGHYLLALRSFDGRVYMVDVVKE